MIDLLAFPSKYCAGCERYLSLDSFTKDRSAKDGLQRRCRDCRKSYNKKYFREYLANPKRAEENRARARQWSKDNPGKFKERHKRWRDANADKIRQWGRKHRKRRPDLVKAAKHRHLARARHDGSFTAAEWRELKAKYNYTCLCCGKQEPEIKLEPDHVIPVSRGGSGLIHNIQPLCRTCNNKKNTDDTDYRPVIP